MLESKCGIYPVRPPVAIERVKHTAAECRRSVASRKLGTPTVVVIENMSGHVLKLAAERCERGEWVYRPPKSVKHGYAMVLLLVQSPVMSGVSVSVILQGEGVSISCCLKQAVLGMKIMGQVVEKEERPAEAIYCEAMQSIEAEKCKGFAECNGFRFEWTESSDTEFFAVYPSEKYAALQEWTKTNATDIESASMFNVTPGMKLKMMETHPGAPVKSFEDFWCDGCQMTIVGFVETFCRTCGAQMTQSHGLEEQCPQCHSTEKALKRISCPCCKWQHIPDEPNDPIWRPHCAPSEASESHGPMMLHPPRLGPSERLISYILQEAGQKGLRECDIQFRSKLTCEDVRKALKFLKAHMLVQELSGVHSSKLEVFVPYDVKPSDHLLRVLQHKGSAWRRSYDFVKVVRNQCYMHIKQQPCSTKTLVDWIWESEFSYESLYESDVRKILDTLCYDGLIELDGPSLTAGGNAVYKVTKPRAVDFVNPLSRTPCGKCPVFDDCMCMENAAISPFNCPYMTDWMELF